MYKVDVYKQDVSKPSADLQQLSVKRDWFTPATYNCYPMTFVNTIGYEVSFNEDIRFVWDGDVAIPARPLSGGEFIWEGRGEGTVSLTTNLIFKTDKDVSFWTMPIPNHFVEEFDVLSSVISTSFWTGDITVVLKIKKEYIGKEILIPAGKPVASLIPISVSQFDGSILNMKGTKFPFPQIQNTQEYVDALHDYTNETGKRLKLYKRGLDENGNHVGEHEIDIINMNVVYENNLGDKDARG